MNCNHDLGWVATMEWVSDEKGDVIRRNGDAYTATYRWVWRCKQCRALKP